MELPFLHGSKKAMFAPPRCWQWCFVSVGSSCAPLLTQIELYTFNVLAKFCSVSATVGFRQKRFSNSIYIGRQKQSKLLLVFNVSQSSQLKQKQMSYQQWQVIPTSKMQDVLIVVILKNFVFDPGITNIKISLWKWHSESFYYSTRKNTDIHVCTHRCLCAYFLIPFNFRILSSYCESSAITVESFFSNRNRSSTVE